MTEGSVRPGRTVAVTPAGGPAAAVLAALRVSPLVAVLIVLLAVLVLPPVVYLVVTSLYTTTFTGAFDQLTFQYYAEMVGNPRFLHNLVNTVVFSVGSATVAISIGVLLAWIVERTNTPLRKYMMAVAIVSLGMPHVLYTIAWLLILGKAGPINDILRFVLDTRDIVFHVNSMPGMILVEGFVWTPLGFLLLSSILRSADASLEEASMMCGAGIVETFQRVTLRLALPGILALMLLIFIRAFESFEVPALVGLPGGVSVLSTDIYEKIQTVIPPQYGQSAAFAVVLLVLVVVLLQWYNRLSHSAHRYQTITGKGFRPRVMNLGRWRYLTAAFLILFVTLIILLPVAIVLWTAVLPFYDGVNLAALGRLTLANFRLVARSGSFLDSIFNTIALGAGAATLVASVTAVCGWMVVRRFRGAWILDQLATLPLIFPAIVLGVAYLQILLNTPFALYGTLLSLIIVSMVHYLPYGMRYCYAGALQIHSELEEAAAIAGASAGETFRRIVVPLLLPPIVTAWLLTFLLAVRAVAMPILLVGPDSQVVAVTLFDLWNNGQINELAAMGITWTAMMTAVAVVFYAVSRRFGMAFH